jgi:hypothetical protein
MVDSCGTLQILWWQTPFTPLAAVTESIPAAMTRSLFVFSSQSWASTGGMDAKSLARARSLALDMLLFMHHYYLYCDYYYIHGRGSTFMHASHVDTYGPKPEVCHNGQLRYTYRARAELPRAFEI